MSRMPSGDAMPGDARSCDAPELVVVRRGYDMGGVAVRRALPQFKRQMVGWPAIGHSYEHRATPPRMMRRALSALQGWP